jgi:hypothetical protein
MKGKKGEGKEEKREKKKKEKERREGNRKKRKDGSKEGRKEGRRNEGGRKEIDLSRRRCVQINTWAIKIYTYA